MSEQRYDDVEEPGDPLDQQDEDEPDEDEPDDGEPWAKTSSGDADDVTSD